MSFLGRTPPNVPLTTADIPDGIVTSAKLGPNLTVPSLVLTPGSAPATTEGSIYYDSTSDTIQIRNASAWKTIESGTGLMGGNDVVDFGTDRIHTFRSSGIFTVNVAKTVEYLVIAGGGGGGAGSNGSAVGAGGGGAGGYLTADNLSLSVGTYAITVGGGGAGAVPGSPSTDTQGDSGGNSSIAALVVATGGGGGGSRTSGANAGATGGSGGGGSGLGGGSGSATASPSQGNAGGSSDGTKYGGCGGGGAGSVGDNVGEHWGVDGGIGLSSSINGTAVMRAIGGNGGSGGAEAEPWGEGGTGEPGEEGTGNGGGGSQATGSYYGGNGGSGIVIIRYTI